jgi:kynureninase
MDRADFLDLDHRDPLRTLRDQFKLEEGLVYLDGNSLGAMPRVTPRRVAEVVEREWGRGLIGSWEAAGWLEAPQRLGDKVGRLIGAQPGEVLVSDSTTVNLYKLVCAGLDLRPGRNVILTEHSNFPTDLYVAGGMAFQRPGTELRTVDREELLQALDEGVAVLMLTHVDYLTGYIHDAHELTRAAHQAGALVVWDLSHSAGAIPVDLGAWGADLATGCTYKYLCGGPGSPAYIYVASSLQEQAVSPLRGWFGHARPFDFDARYEPAAGVRRFLAGTPAVLALAGLESALDLWLDVDMAAARQKSTALTEAFIDLVSERCRAAEVLSPRDPQRRGSQVSLRHPGAEAAIQEMAARGVVGDFRPPDAMRFGFSALYTRFVDVWDAVDVLVEVIGGSPG